jgi:hypothetical protein
MYANLQKRTTLIINHLHPKTHEITGNKPAKPEMKSKRNMNRNHNTHTCKSVAGLPLHLVEASRLVLTFRQCLADLRKQNEAQEQ